MKPFRPDSRASGQTTTEEVTAEISKANDVPDDPVKLQDSPRSKFRTPGFHRMPLTWNADDAPVLAQAQRVVEERVQENFRDAYQIMHDLFLIVRAPVADPETGEIATDRFGWPEWQRTPSGGWVEDWSALTLKQRENFLFQITTRMFAWEMAAADAWGEAMYARACWEERFSISYDAPVVGTIEDRTARGRIGATEERLFGILCTTYSRKADSIVRSLGLIGQRLKDVMVGGS